MKQDVIPASAAAHPVRPNLVDYGAACAEFTWDAARGMLDGQPAGGLNLGHEAVDRQVAAGRGDRVAVRFLGRGDRVREITYRELQSATNRFANVLGDLGLAPGTRVFSLLGRSPELFIALLGTAKAGCVFSPLFSAFGPEPIAQRLALGDARVLVTTRVLYERKVAGVRDRLPGLAHVLLVDSGEGLPEGTADLSALLAAASPEYEIPHTDPQQPVLLHFTSGTTGTPKGAVHVHEAVVAHHLTARLALDLHPDDVFWCTADPGWVTGTSYGVIAPLTVGVTLVVDEEELDVARWYRILEQQGVTVWYTAPTALRMLKLSGVLPPDLPQLRFIASVGEPLTPDLVLWSLDAFGQPAHDTWWQTETGAIMIANFAAEDVVPGAMGRPIPGIRAAVALREGDQVAVQDRHPVFAADGEQGELVLRTGWPSLFRGYLNDPQRYADSFVDGWYCTGDLVHRDSDGRYWFVGRGNDVIKSAGHLIGPFEVESALLEHPGVAEAGVVGKPDPIAGELVVAFVRPAADYEPNDQLRRELLGFSRKRLGAAVAPREITFATTLPKTNSGKILRRELRERCAAG